MDSFSLEGSDTVTKADIVDALCAKDYYKSQASDVLDDVLQIIRDALIRGDTVQIRGFGVFEVKTRKGRKSQDISTGEMRVSSDRKIPTFRASNSLKEAVRSGYCGEVLEDDE